MMIKYLVLSLTIICANLNFANAETAEEKGLRIAKEMQKRNEGFKGETSEMKMVLIDAQGNTIERKMTGQTMEILEDGDKSLLTFLLPLDIKGTKMLTWGHKEADDDQWLYLPSIRRVKRISSSGRASSFMGSEFTYEDLGSQEVDKYEFKYLKEVQSSEKETLHVVQRKSKKKSGYSKVVLWFNKANAQAVKAEYFDRKGELLKTAVQSNFAKYQVAGKELWRASKIHMKNSQTRKESIFEWTNRKLGVQHKENDFSKRGLK